MLSWTSSTSKTDKLSEVCEPSNTRHRILVVCHSRAVILDFRFNSGRSSVISQRPHCWCANIRNKNMMKKHIISIQSWSSMHFALLYRIIFRSLDSTQIQWTKINYMNDEQTKTHKLDTDDIHSTLSTYVMCFCVNGRHFFCLINCKCARRPNFHSSFLFVAEST